MDYIKPKALTKGDTIAFIAPAGGVKDRDAIYRAKNYFENNGFKIVFSQHLFSEKNYLSDNDENRLSDLIWAFKSSDIDAVICARGGYGCLRLTDKIDYDLIIQNPKPFCGYSDITVLSSVFLKQSGLITYSSPMARGDFGKESVSSFTINNFFKTVEKKEELVFCSNKIYKQGTASGITFGGNLSSVVSLAGIDFVPDDDFIFFAEDLNEPVYKIDKMFTQLLNIKNFKQRLKAIVLGDFLDSGYPEQLEELFFEISEKLNIPVIGGFKLTHNSDKITLPIGAKCILDNSKIIINQY